MGDPYVLMIIALGVLAVLDLVVGVSNDAVNFLNSAIGSKAIPVKKIMIIASFGVFFGAISSSGMMEVARKGIFNPEMFMFQDIMFIFMAVMITDILLLDLFNYLGMPTSTTVSIVFELLGAAVIISLIKIFQDDTQTISEIWNYINYETATKIIFGILLSVVVAFSVGALVQYLSRVIYSFNIDKKGTFTNSIFGGLAITAITYFIFIKGLKGTPFYKDLKHLFEDNTLLIVAISFMVWTLASFLLIKLLKTNILKVIIGIGTFSLAVAFSGNDLVNFIGVPVAAFNSYEIWSESGVAATEFSMEVLASKVPSNVVLLLIAGAIMVVTLWTSSKAKKVIETELNLSRQGDGHEKFQPNNISRFVVRTAMLVNYGFNLMLPKKTQHYINSKFEKPMLITPKGKTKEAPAFDLVRASVNLMVASILISIATSMKLPLSTTYVTFMVAMGTSLADRAWGRESAVYRVAGVINVIGGWFLTAIVAFTAAAIVASLIQWSMYMIIVLLAIVAAMLTRTTILHRKREKEEKLIEYEERAELISINGVIEESSDHISKVAKRTTKLYNDVVKNLTNHNLDKLKKTDKGVAKLNNDIDQLKDGVYYFIKSLEEESVGASKFYIHTLGYLQDIAQAIGFISRASYKHVNNNHKNLKKGQLKQLLKINTELEALLTILCDIFESRNFDDLETLILKKSELLEDIGTSIQEQVTRIRKEESSPKNTTLFFSVLLETQDLVTAFMNLLQLYQEFHLTNKSKE